MYEYIVSKILVNDEVTILNIMIRVLLEHEEYNLITHHCMIA